MLNIEKKIIRKELKYKGEVILKYNIEYPQVSDSMWIIATKIFNKYNFTKAMLLKNMAEGELFDEAKETYEYNKKNGYPIMVLKVSQ